MCRGRHRRRHLFSSVACFARRSAGLAGVVPLPLRDCAPLSNGSAFNTSYHGTKRAVTKTEFEASFQALAQAHAKTTSNVKCLACERCERCTDCTFCTQSKNLTRCHYANGCTDCVDCSHCDRSTGCLACTHCVECERCSGSAYLVRSIGCSGCTYCFGCVGLSRKDFHILNEPYDRATYFELTKQLSAALRI